MATGTYDDLRRARRVLCYGVTGSGKSAAAGRLGTRLGLPVHLVDEEIGWLPGWVERPVIEQRAIAAAIVATDAWVLDSAYGKWFDEVAVRTEAVVALDYPRWLSLARLIRRTGHRAITGEEMCNGNVESWRQMVSKNSILRWHFRSYARKTARIRAWEADPTFLPVLRLTHPRELDALLRCL